MKPRTMGLLVLLGACVVVTLVWIRLPKEHRPGFEPPTPTNAEFHAGRHSYDLAWRADRELEFVATIRESVAAAMSGAQMDEGAVGLGDIASEHVAMVIQADYERWLSFVRRYVPDWQRHSDDEKSSESFRSRWNEQARALAESRVSTGGVRVVRIKGDARAFPEHLSEPGTMIASARAVPGSMSVNPSYPAPSGPGVECYEVQIPVEVSPLGGDRVNAIAGFRYARERAGSPWVPVDLVLYFDSSAFGKQFVDPIY